MKTTRIVEVFSAVKVCRIGFRVIRSMIQNTAPHAWHACILEGRKIINAVQTTSQ